MELIRTAVRSGLFPLPEVFDGLRYRIIVCPGGMPIGDYVTHQRRYMPADVNPALFKRGSAEQWHYLESMARAFPADGA